MYTLLFEYHFQALGRWCLSIKMSTVSYIYYGYIFILIDTYDCAWRMDGFPIVINVDFTSIYNISFIFPLTAYHPIYWFTFIFSFLFEPISLSLSHSHYMCVCVCVCVESLRFIDFYVSIEM